VLAETCLTDDEPGCEYGEPDRHEVAEVVVVERGDDEQNRGEEKQESSKADVHLFSFRVKRRLRPRRALVRGTGSISSRNP
jgi:hypothetical protein